METMTKEATRFIGEEHKHRFEELMKIQMATRPQIFKREMAVIYLVSGLHYQKPEELFHSRGCFPRVDVAIRRFEEGVLDQRDAVLFLLAHNLYNGLDEFESFGIEGKATPYHFACLLGREAFMIAEATKLFIDGYDITTIE